MVLLRACLIGVLVLLPRLAWAGCSPIAFGEPVVTLAGATPDTVTVTFLGHASFLIEFARRCARRDRLQRHQHSD